MAIVKEQDLPLEGMEDELDPPIPFIDTYRRVLSEGIDHPGLPAGEEIVTFSKRESRPATRSVGSSSPTAANQAWRDKFRECLDCWENQVDTDDDVDDCHSAGSRHYVKPWEYVPGAQNTVFHQFMKDCLEWKRDHPDEEYPPCEDLNPTPNPFYYCPGDVITFEVANGNEALIVSCDCGPIVEELQIEIDSNSETCPESCVVKFSDTDDRKGCAYGVRKDDGECECSDPPALGIEYTTLLMSCSQQQNLFVDGDNPGVAPYTWELEGGGSLSTYEGGATVYTSPATNPNCVENPTIKVIDACDQEAEIKLAINCYSPLTVAYRVAAVSQSSLAYWNAECEGTHTSCPYRQVVLTGYAYACNGSARYGSNTYLERIRVCHPDTSDGCVLVARCADEGVCVSPWIGGTEGCCSAEKGPTHCYLENCDYHCDDVIDARTQAMKDGGCCPLNPITGEPF